MQINFLNPEFLFKKIYDFFTGVALLPFIFLFIEWLREFLERIKGVSTIVSLILLTGIGYSIIRIRQIRKREEEFFVGLAEVAPAKTGNEVIAEGPRNAKWEKVQ